MSYRDTQAYFPKYRTLRRSTGDELDPNTTFTLVPERDPHAVVALRAYTDSVEHEMPGFAKVLRDHFGL